jgi:aspartate aminotransferase, cytoplasmic
LILADPKMNHEYLGLAGHVGFIETAQKIVFGEENEAIVTKRIATVQTISGTGALMSGLALLKKSAPGVVYVSNPTWPMHYGLVAQHGLPIREYPYWNEQSRSVNFAKMKEFLSSCAAGSIILLHSCAHNPTGSDLTPEQWDDLVQIFTENQLIAFFDLAYQGFATGDLNTDACSVRLFSNKNLTFLVAQSLAKNFGLYGERIGALHVVCQDPDTARLVFSHLESIARSTYLTPPMHGALIVDTIWRNPELQKSYIDELAQVSGRITEARYLLRSELERLKVPGDWSHITSQRGMFSFTGLSPAQCEYLLTKKKVYIIASGRINVAGINSNNVARVAQAFLEAINECK